MIKHLFKPLVILFTLTSHQAISQHEFFHELFLEKTLIENDEWGLEVEASWKHVYEEPKWRRWGVSLVGTREMNNFSVLSGVNGFYTFNKKITNFFELRPWAALEYKIPLVAGIALRQRLRYEWRFFFSAEDNTREDYSRLRYQLGFDIPLSRESESTWKIRPFFEWYFIRDPATFERFSNERDYGFRLIKELENEHELKIGYQFEEFYNTEVEKSNGHTILLGYSF